MEPYLWIIVAEPSPFRSAETSVFGPYRKRKALRMARRYCIAHPFAECRVIPADVTVMRGEEQIW